MLFVSLLLVYAFNVDMFCFVCDYRENNKANNTSRTSYL